MNTPNEPKIVRDRVRMNIWVKRHLYNSAIDIAKEDDKSLNDVVREALKNYIDKRKSQGGNND